MRALYALSALAVVLAGCGGSYPGSCEDRSPGDGPYSLAFSGIVIGVRKSDSAALQKAVDETFGAAEADEANEANGYVALVTAIPLMVHGGGNACGRKILVPVRSSNDRAPILLEWIDVLGVEAGE